MHGQLQMYLSTCSHEMFERKTEVSRRKSSKIISVDAQNPQKRRYFLLKNIRFSAFSSTPVFHRLKRVFEKFQISPCQKRIRKPFRGFSCDSKNNTTGYHFNQKNVLQYHNFRAQPPPHPFTRSTFYFRNISAYRIPADFHTQPTLSPTRNRHSVFFQNLFSNFQSHF